MRDDVQRPPRWSLVARAVAAAVGAPTTEVREILAAEIADERVEGAKGGAHPLSK